MTLSDSAPVLAVWVSPWVANDGVFQADHPENRDDEYYGARVLRQLMEAKGWRVHTHDVVQRMGLKPKALLFFDLPRKPVIQLVADWAQEADLYAMLVESPLVRPYLWEEARHKPFKAMFTWHSDLIGRPGYVEVGVGNKLDRDITLKRDLVGREKLCVLIAGNKRPRISSPLDLYAKRLECIRWFEAHHPGDFDLYGVGWNDASIRYSARLRRMGLMGLVNRLLGAEKHPCWRGPIKEKIPVLERYRFNIAFENVRDIPGYVTEKIFDSFLGSTVPVYWGAPNVTDFIPKDCFIDFRDYGTFEKLYARLSTMPDDEYLGYLDRIEAFLRSPAADPFRADMVVAIIARQIAG